MTLSELHALLATRVWTAGRYTPPTTSSPLGIWGCTTPGMALDRAKAERGWAWKHAEVPSSWDCPVVLGMRISEDWGYGEHKKLKSGTSQVMRKLVHTAQVPIEELHIVTIFIPRNMYIRYNRLRDIWRSCIAGEYVLCRTPEKEVEVFFQSGHGKPWSCGRWIPISDAEACGWKLSLIHI